ncbi:uncharacterized protein [Amphiura filiformis]|uniref:uncharacterized protein n=1 Tax=Amphiura filiformis TaxID=82378 RepID=UPI003B21D5B6
MATSVFGYHCGRKGSKLLVGAVCVSFWMTISVLYYGVHHYDHERQSSSITSGNQLKRDTREGVGDFMDEVEMVKKRQRTTVAQKGPHHVEVNTEKEDVKITSPWSSDLFIFPPCKNGTERFFFDPTILKNGEKRRQFTGRKLVPYVSVYPADGTMFLNKRKRDGNTVIPRKVVDKLREDFKAATTYRRDFRNSISNIVRVELMAMMGGLSFGGRLFLIEMATTVHRRPSAVDTSTYHTEYAIDSGQGDGICHPMDYAIHSDSKVYVIVTVKNLEEWVGRLIKEFEQIQEQPGDCGDFELILTDFNNTDIALVHMVNASVISPKIKILVNMGDTYNKGAAVKSAVDLIQNPNDIVFLCDVHLEIPSIFLSDVRKHVIRNKMVFAPVVGKLEKDSSPDNPQGEWDIDGFSVIAMTKSDWDMIGGITTKEFKGDQWGDEDWEMIDRIVNSGLLVNRRRVPSLFINYHDVNTRVWPSGRAQVVAGGQEVQMSGREELETSQRKEEMRERDDLLELHVGPGRRRMHSFNANAEEGLLT